VSGVRAAATADRALVLAALRRETDVLVDRALTVFLDIDFLDHDVLGGRLSGGHVVTYLARQADAMADELLAATGRPVPPIDRDRRWEIDEGGNLRPGAVLIDDLQVSAERLESALAGVDDWSTLDEGPREIPARRLLQVVVHHADLGRPWAAIPAEDAAIAAALLPEVLAAELAGFVLEPSGEETEPVVRSGDGGPTVIQASPRALLAWATGRGEAGLSASPLAERIWI